MKQKRNYNAMLKTNQNIKNMSENSNEINENNRIKKLIVPKLTFTNNINKELEINNIQYIRKKKITVKKNTLNSSKNYNSDIKIFNKDDSILLFNNFESNFVKKRNVFILEKSKIKKKILCLIFVVLL